MEKEKLITPRSARSRTWKTRSPGCWPRRRSTKRCAIRACRTTRSRAPASLVEELRQAPRIALPQGGAGQRAEHSGLRAGQQVGPDDRGQEAGLHAPELGSEGQGRRVLPRRLHAPVLLAAAVASDQDAEHPAAVGAAGPVRRELDIIIKVEALVLDNAPVRPTLLAGGPRDGPARRVRGLPRLQPPSDAEGRGSPVVPAGVLAEPSREYLAIAGKTCSSGH